MPLTKAKPSQSQQVRKKSEIADLFSRLMTLYNPGPLPPLSLPVFQGADIPVLLFPTLQVAQARVWRNWEGPHSEELKVAINEVCLRGLAWDQVCFVIGLCEALFRPLLAVELQLERLFPNFLFSRGHTWPPSAAACDLLASDFRQRWKEEEKSYGREWVLAAGGVPLRLRQRPALVAPWVVGAVVKRWLTLKGTSENEAIKLASELIAVLLKRKVRAEELQHWGDLMEKILVTMADRKVPLPGYLIEPIARLNLPVWPEQMPPARFLEAFPIDVAACEQFAQLLQRAWFTHDQRKKTVRTKKRVTRPEDQRMFSCSLCELGQISTEAIWPHLRDVHRILDFDLEIPEWSDEIRQKSAARTVATWKEIG